MTRFRSSLFLLAIAALFISGLPVAAGTADSGLPLRLDANQCTNPVPSPAVGTPVPSREVSPPFDDFILCTCKFCDDHRDVDCQISPSGYTILCEDYFRTHCSG